MKTHGWLSIILPSTAAQLVTAPARILQHQKLAPRQSGDISSLINSSTLFSLDEPACTTQLAIHDRCSAEYGVSGLKNLYCECTDGIVEAKSKCAICESIEYPATDTSSTFDQTSHYSSQCASLSVRYGNATSTPSGYFDPATFVSTFPKTLTDSAALTTSVSIPTDLLSGLVLASPTIAPNTGLRTAVPTSSVSDRLCVATASLLILGLSVSSGIFFFTH